MILPQAELSLNYFLFLEVSFVSLCGYLIKAKGPTELTADPNAILTVKGGQL